MGSRTECPYAEEMMKKINPKILSIPPYISTSWRNINTLHAKETKEKLILVIGLHNGTSINVPDLEKETLKEIFESHSKYLEQEAKDSQTEPLKNLSSSHTESDLSFSFGLPFQMHSQFPVFNAKLNPTSFLEHNPNQANAPKMPPEVIKKITSITKALGLDLEQMNIPKAEPHCNCPYCQLARAIQTGHPKSGPEEGIDEEISPEDLTFRDWDIKQQGDKLYIVSNPLNANEHYQVYLGSPIGCTCGKKNCEHVRSVLKS